MVEGLEQLAGAMLSRTSSALDLGRPPLPASDFMSCRELVNPYAWSNWMLILAISHELIPRESKSDLGVRRQRAVPLSYRPANAMSLIRSYVERAGSAGFLAV